ncbi:hypothetical protein STAL104432_32035 [Streptomyces albus]
MERAAGTEGRAGTAGSVRVPAGTGSGWRAGAAASAFSGLRGAARRAEPYLRCTACLVTPSAEPTASQEKPSERSKSTAAVTRVSTLSRSSWASLTVGAGARP